ncbi:EF-P lysine aminoacylase EpmA [Marinospirillum insulare]|uniref:Elongation factor P--(R)-beta-lysine ligase n=1 Tax=Marinospirillum insulare TaxID=217169 RepID=A0ABQ5ZZV4_9GAMM|nr:EF-P lysine aminoacylase EpmA [Marinospirillum insulare]GLR63410.1 elongation factor P--(R)-beta-lysine ligase [Marinospirillum insulare]
MQLAILKKRAELLSATRHFFNSRGVLEVNTPVLAPAGSTDPLLDSFVTQLEGGSTPSQLLYLQTSPEFYMKRLLAEGSGAIYQLGPCFRNGELSQRHNPEFLMLEWYRPDWKLSELEAECCALFDELLGVASYQRRTYREAFIEFVGLDPFKTSLAELRRTCVAVSGIDAEQLDRDGCLDLLLSHKLEPALKNLGRVILYEFPASQAALAQIHQDAYGNPVASRFELYINGLELANAYQELTSASEQATRFEADNAQRHALGKPQVTADAKLVAALEKGLPDCSGIAVGFDRLVMLACDAASLDEVQTFSAYRW